MRRTPRCQDHPRRARRIPRRHGHRRSRSPVHVQHHPRRPDNAHPRILRGAGQPHGGTGRRDPPAEGADRLILRIPRQGPPRPHDLRLRVPQAHLGGVLQGSRRGVALPRSLREVRHPRRQDNRGLLLHQGRHLENQGKDIYRLHRRRRRGIPGRSPLRLWRRRGRPPGELAVLRGPQH